MNRLLTSILLLAAFSASAQLVNGNLRNGEFRSYTNAVAAGGGGPTVVATDNFDSYANLTDLNTSGNWEKRVGIFTVLNGTGTAGTVVNGAAGNQQLYRYSTLSFNSDQYASCVLSTLSNFERIGVAVRVSSSATTGYFMEYDEGNTLVTLGYYSAGTKTDATTATIDLAVNAQLRLRCSGAGASARLDGWYDNGGGWVQIFTSYNPAVDIDNGSAGLSGDGSGTSLAITSWIGGNW
jgi:hypothetical protein